MAWALSVKLFPYICVALYHLKHIFTCFLIQPSKTLCEGKNSYHYNDDDDECLPYANVKHSTHFVLFNPLTIL